MTDDPDFGFHMVEIPDLTEEEFHKMQAMQRELYTLFKKYEFKTENALSFIAFMLAYTMNDRTRGNLDMAMHNITAIMGLALKLMLDFKSQDDAGQSHKLQ